MSITAALIVAIMGVIFNATSHGSILGRLWRAFKMRFGRICRSITFLQGLGRRQLSNDLQHMLTSDPGLNTAAQQFYLPQPRRTRALTPYHRYRVYTIYEIYDVHDEREVYIRR